MEINTIIEVQCFADCGTTCTQNIMVHNDKLDTKIIYQEFYTMKNIESNKGLDYRQLSALTDEFVDFLKSKGFTELETEKFYFTD